MLLCCLMLSGCGRERDDGRAEPAVAETDGQKIDTDAVQTDGQRTDVPQEPETETVRIACVGDSITEGYGATGYPVFLEEMLGDGYEVGNFGVSGTTAMRDGVYPYASTSAYQQSLEYDADLVILMFGTNDANAAGWKGQEQFRQQYEELVGAYLSLENEPDIYLCTPIAVCSADRDDSATVGYGIQPDVYDEIIDAIETVAEKYGLPVLDMYTLTEGHTDWYNDDGIHPSDQGAREIAGVVYEAVDKGGSHDKYTCSGRR